MHCPRCQFDNPPTMHFCVECGARLERRCPACGAEAQPTFKFCGQCGAALGTPVPVSAPAPLAQAQGYRHQEAKIPSYTPRHLAEKILTARSALEGERRQVTVLFADVANFTTLAAQLDPEEVHTIIEHCFERITAEVHRFEGTINQYTGDGVMALFGAPIAHEDGPRRAVHAALGIQRAVREYGQELQAQRDLLLQMRIGINTGLVVVGKSGDDLRMDYTAVGDTTNLAARLQQNARPGSVVISDATHRLVAGFFETLDLGEMPVRGRAPARAFEVLRPRGRRARLDMAIERGLTPLIGRERELATLLDRFGEVKAGRGQVVFIAGEAGIGKSRLVLEFRQALAAAGEAATWLEGRCISFGQSIPFLPLIDQLRENFRIEESDGEPEIIAKIEHGMRRMGELEAHIPSIRYLLAVDPGDPAVMAMDAAARRQKLFDAALALPLRGARLRPLVLVFEDLHWLDTSTEEYLSVLMDAVAAVPLLLILTYRIGYTPPFGSRSFHTTLMLRSLSEADSLAMAGRVLGGAQFPGGAAHHPRGEGGGSPPVHRGGHQDPPGSRRPATGERQLSPGQRSRRGARAGHHPGAHHGPAGPPRRARQTHRPTRLGHRPAVFGASPGADLGAHRPAGGVAVRLKGAGDYLRAGAASRAGLYFQTRGDPGCGVSQPPGTAAERTSSSRRVCDRRALSRPPG